MNGVLVAYGGMVPFIATLAMLASARGLALQITDGKTQIVTVPSVLDLGLPDAYVLGIPPLVLVFAAVTIAGWLLLNRTTFGRRTVVVRQVGIQIRTGQSAGGLSPLAGRSGTQPVKKLTDDHDDNRHSRPRRKHRGAGAKPSPASPDVSARDLRNGSP